MKGFDKCDIIEQELFTNGHHMKERKEVFTNAGGEIGTCTQVHTRFIGNDSYKVTRIIQGGCYKSADQIETTMTPSELHEFQLKWSKLWKISLSRN